MEDYTTFPPDSKVWIYQSSRDLTPVEVDEIKAKSHDFSCTWTAHEQQMRSTVEVFYNRFIVIFADQNQAMASGCSIDKSVGFIKTLEKTYNITLLDRMNIAYLENKEVSTFPFNELDTKSFMGTINENTLIFNNLVQTKEEFDSKWIVPLKDSWLHQYLKIESLGRV